MTIHFFTIVYNGIPWITKHYDVFKSLNVPWHWHVVEGPAANVHCTSWCAKLPVGPSTDGTVEYLKSLLGDFRVSLYQSDMWPGKIAMVNAPLPWIFEPCLLWEVDSDELWTKEKIEAVVKLFESDPSKNCAYFWCNYFVGPDVVTATRHAYGNNDGYEWHRVWKFDGPPTRFITHEPPKLKDFVECSILHDVTEAAGAVFDHMAYATEEQVAFKERYYAGEGNPNGALYRGAVDGWRRLQENTQWPVKLKDFLPWVGDNATAVRVAADKPQTKTTMKTMHVIEFGDAEVDLADVVAKAREVSGRTDVVFVLPANAVKFLPILSRCFPVIVTDDGCYLSQSEEVLADFSRLNLAELTHQSTNELVTDMVGIYGVELFAEIRTFMGNTQLGQITPDSSFGKLLTQLAGQAKTIVEIGTWRGLGSTLCLATGLKSPDQRFITVDSGLDKVQEASSRHNDPRITFLHGRVSPPSDLLPRQHPCPAALQYYDGEKQAQEDAPDITGQLPEHIDLLVLDGGEWSTYGDFEMLLPRCDVIAVDDANREKAEKGWRVRHVLLEEGWSVIADCPEERNGYFVASRPAKK